jgi:nucleoid-associated protein YgaU
VRGGSSSTAPDQGESSQQGRSYTVKPGDSLSKIAQQVYGNMNDWRKIYDANRDIIQNPDLIHPGQTLRLP